MLVREEAFPFAAPPAILGAALAALGHAWWAFPFGVMALCVCAFFRDPERSPPEGEDLILSPADGKVIQIGEMGGRMRISVFMSVFSVHVNRAPFAGLVGAVRYNKGKFMAAWSEKASLDNEQVRVALSTARGEMEVVQIAGLVARRIVSWAREGSRFERGQRIGLIRFGSRVDIYLPPDAVEVVAREGDMVRAGSSTLARWRSPA